MATTAVPPNVAEQNSQQQYNYVGLESSPVYENATVGPFPEQNTENATAYYGNQSTPGDAYTAQADTAYPAVEPEAGDAGWNGAPGGYPGETGAPEAYPEETGAPPESHPLEADTGNLQAEPAATGNDPEGADKVENTKAAEETEGGEGETENVSTTKQSSVQDNTQAASKPSYGKGSTHGTSQYYHHTTSKNYRQHRHREDNRPSANPFDPYKQQVYHSPCQIGVIPMRSAAFQAPRIPLPKLCRHLLPECDECDEEEDGVAFQFKPQTHCRTEVTFVIEPKPQPPWLTMLNCGFKPMVNCSAPPCYLSPSGNPGMDFMGGTQSVINRAFGSEVQYCGMANFPTLQQIQNAFPGGKIIDGTRKPKGKAKKGHAESNSSSSGSGTEEDEEEVHLRSYRYPYQPVGLPQVHAHSSTHPGHNRVHSHMHHHQRSHHSHPTGYEQDIDSSNKDRQNSVIRHEDKKKAHGRTIDDKQKDSKRAHQVHGSRHRRKSQHKRRETKTTNQRKQTLHNLEESSRHHAHSFSTERSDERDHSILSRSSDWHA